jgi:hypothetical protein
MVLLQGFLSRGIPGVTIDTVHNIVMKRLYGHIPHLDALFGVPEAYTQVDSLATLRKTALNTSSGT